MSGSETDIQWFIARDGKQHGPVSDAELRKLIELSHMKPADLVWRQGFTDWRTAGSVFPSIAEAKPSAQPSAPAAPSADAAPSAAQTRAPHNEPAAPKPATIQPSTIQPSSMSPPGPSPRAFEPATSPSPAPAPLSHPMAPGTSRFGAASAPASNPGQAQPSNPAQPSGQPQPLAQAGPRPSAPQASDTWRPHSADMRPDQNSPRPLGSAPGRTAGPFSAPGQGPHLSADGRIKSPEMVARRREPPPPSGGGRRRAMVIVGLVAMTGAGAWLASQYKDQLLGSMQSQPSATTASDTGPGPTSTANVMQAPSGVGAPPAGPDEAAAVAASSEDIDRQLQGRHMWVAVKEQFPDWYQGRVAEVARLTAEHKDQSEISRYLIGEFVTLRRENAKHALAASTGRHKELAAAFLANLKQLSAESGDGCYDFISKGESSPVIVSRMGDPAKSAEIEAQVVAIVGAIAEGRSQPAQHSAPVKTDYDVLAGELGRLGWTQTDMQLFANPKELAKAPRDRVCNMLKDWFTAHLSIQDPSTQERLLFETLKPVISG